MKTSNLINVLAEDAAMHRTLRRTLVLAVVCAIASAGAIFFLFLGFRANAAASLESPRFLFKFAFTLSLAVAGIGLAARVARPGGASGIWGWGLFAISAMLCIAVAVELTTTQRSAWVTLLMGGNAIHCLTLVPLMAAGPLACLLLALRRGAPDHPGRAGAIAGIAASGIAAAFYAANCPDDSPLFVATWYPLAISAVAAIGYCVGSTFLRW